MITQIQSRQIKGKGRGKLLCFPTINLEIPKNLILADGIYAVWVKINEEKFLGALHFGPVPTFQEKERSLEIFLIDIKTKLPNKLSQPITVELLKKIREIKNFSSIDKLKIQIDQDVKKIRSIILK